MQASQKAARVIRPYSPSKWYDCWRHRVNVGLSATNKFYRSLNNEQSEQLHYWLSQCFMKIDMLLFHHDNHAMQLECTHHASPTAPDNSIRFVAKHNLPRALITSTELPIGYVNFKKYHDFLQQNNENLYADLLSSQSELTDILKVASSVNDDEASNPHYKHLHPPQTFWTPKYSHIEGYNHPMWEMVDCIVEYLYRMGIYFNQYDRPLRLDNIDEKQKVNDRLIHYLMIQTFVYRYTHEFHDPQCPNPLYEMSENPPSRLCEKYPYVLPILFSEIFRIIHMNGYINQTLYLRNTVGHGLYSLSSYYDHSCDPNLVYATFNGKLRMILIKEIKQSEPLTTSYLAEFIDQIDVEERKERLKWMGFVCKCERCRKTERSENEKQKILQHQKEIKEDEYRPTVWSELRYFHHVLSEGIDARWSSRLFRSLSLGSKRRMTKWFMKHKVKTGIAEPAYETFHTLDVLAPDAAFGDILCQVALKKYRKQMWDRDTSDRELQADNM